MGRASMDPDQTDHASTARVQMAPHPIVGRVASDLLGRARVGPVASAAQAGRAVSAAPAASGRLGRARVAPVASAAPAVRAAPGTAHRGRVASGPMARDRVASAPKALARTALARAVSGRTAPGSMRPVPTSAVEPEKVRAALLSPRGVSGSRIAPGPHLRPDLGAAPVAPAASGPARAVLAPAASAARAPAMLLAPAASPARAPATARVPVLRRAARSVKDPE
jgi:hypothetical protein